MTRRPIDEKLMTDFLLGNLPEEEIERLDELSLADDDFANRLQSAENDLVDAYVKGGLSGTSLSQFKSNYLRSPKRQEKVAFAEALQKQISKPAFAVRRSDFQWGFAAAAVIILLLGGYLIFENMQLQNEIQQMQVEQESFRHREQQLQKQIADLKHQSSPKPENVKLLAFVLLPQTRGINKIPVLNIPDATDFVVLTLKSEPNDFSIYQAALRDSAKDEIIWKSGNLTADKNTNSVQVKIPASLLKPQNYLMELSGVSASGQAEIVSSYPLKIAAQ